MKHFIAVALTFSVAAFSQTFNFKSTTAGEFETSSKYKLPAKVSVEVGSVKFVNNKLAKVDITFNGKKKTVDMEILKGDSLYHGEENVYKGVVEVHNLTRSFCSEYESVEFETTIHEEGEYDHYSYVTDVELKAVKYYTYDSCHSEVETEEYEYTKEQ